MPGKQWLQVLVTAQLFFAVPIFAAQSESSATKVIHLDGGRARALISILVSGGVANSEQMELQEAHPVPHRVGIVLHDLDLSLASTYKYDPDTWIYKLDVYSATAKIGSTANRVPVGEGAALWNFLTDAGIKPDLSLGSSDLMVQKVDCTVDGQKAISVPDQFHCDLTVPSWAADRAQPADESAPDSPVYTQQRTLWVAQVLRQIEAVRPGMTRRDLESFMTHEGGISTRQRETYVYRSCPYIKVDVVFAPARAKNEADPIVSISRPYLQFSETD